jgi:predicted SAM-dependent methyltransferase
LKNNDGFHAFNLPEQCVDYIHSSHCLEHLTDWVEALQYWISKLKPGGLLFLYLPHKDQTYWLPWNNRKHKHVLDAKLIKSCIESFGMENVVYSDRDLNYSFALIATKKV